MSNADIGVLFSPPWDNILTSNASNTAITLNNASQTATLTVTATEKGRIQAFLATASVNGGTTARQGYVTCKITRSGLTIVSTPIFLGGTEEPQGLVFYETLNVLSNSQVAKGEPFVLTLTLSGHAAGTIIPMSATLNLVLAVIE